MRSLLDEAARLLGLEGPLLVSGENGTGKSSLVRSLLSPGAYQEWPLVSSAQADPRHLAFGWKKGFGQWEGSRIGFLTRCKGGIQVVDHLELVDRPQQFLLTQFLADSMARRAGSPPYRINVQLVFITPDPESAVRAGKIIRPLYERLRHRRIHIPPLRERREDIGPLLQHYLDDNLRESGGPPPILTPDALSEIRRWKLEGNSWNLSRLAHELYFHGKGKTFDREALLVFRYREKLMIQ